jgi:CDP-glucose 4,6-dehydratase
MTAPADGFWAGRRVLVTGHTGFKGAWLTLWLQQLGAEVAGFALAPDDDRSTFPALGPWPGLHSIIGDLRDPNAVAAAVRETEPEVVFHLAAQALVRRGYAEPFDTYHVNVVGTANLLEQLRRAPSVRAVVVVTSDKVYANTGAARPFAEGDPLGGSDPYSASKALAELLVEGWRAGLGDAPQLAVSTARAGNVIGGGDRGAERLLPDAWRALERGAPLRLRYPEATRPWQFVLDPLHGYILLAERLVCDPSHAPEAVNFGPDDGSSTTVREVVERLFRVAGAGRWEPADEPAPPEARSLALDSALARRVLGWTARVPLDAALEWTAMWWRARERGEDLRALALYQLAAYDGLLLP